MNTDYQICWIDTPAKIKREQEEMIAKVRGKSKKKQTRGNSNGK